jgi:hypothetical protein
MPIDPIRRRRCRGCFLRRVALFAWLATAGLSLAACGGGGGSPAGSGGGGGSVPLVWGQGVWGRDTWADPGQVTALGSPDPTRTGLDRQETNR